MWITFLSAGISAILSGMTTKNISSLGGRAIMRKLGKKGRSEMARRAATIRWNNHRAKLFERDAKLAKRRERDRARRAAK